MSSITRVMQKIREDTGASELAVQEELTECPPGTAVPHSAPESSNFVAEPPPPPAAGSDAATPLGVQTTTWDRRQVDPAVVAYHDRYSLVCEQYRAVRAWLLNMNPQRRPLAIVITSSAPQEGKSVSALNLGLVMAEGGENRILVVDADLRRSALARMLGVPGSPGLADVLRGSVPLANALQLTPLPNLRFLPAGDLGDATCGELLGGPAGMATLGALRDRFDYVLIDTPPVTAVSDVCLLAPHCDGALVVVQARRTPAPLVQRAVRALQANNVAVLGCLLTRHQDGGIGSRYARYCRSQRVGA